MSGGTVAGFLNGRPKGFSPLVAQATSSFPATPLIALHNRTPATPGVIRPASQAGQSDAVAQVLEANSQPILGEVSSRDRTIAVHGIAFSNRESLLLSLRQFGHIERVAGSRSDERTIFVTFGNQRAVEHALNAQNLLPIEGQRFAISTSASLDDEDVVGLASASPHASDSTRPGGTKAAAVHIQRRKLGFLSALPFADRWILPLLSEGSRKRARSAGRPH